MTPGDAFYLTLVDSHRYFVAFANEDRFENQIIIFNFSTYRSGKCDETCRVTPSEYPGIVNESVVAYSYGDLLDGDRLIAFKKEIGTPLPKLTKELLDRIIQGALTSPHTARKIKRLLEP